MGNNIIHRKDNLIITTIDILNEVGFQGLSTREIAKRQNISEATIFRHYKNKTELLGAVLDYYSQYDEDIFQSVQLKKLTPIKGITFLVTSYTEYCENYPAITSVIQFLYDLLYEPELSDQAKNILRTRNGYMKLLVEEAQKSGEISKNLDSGLIADIIMGFCREVCLKWRMDGFSYSLTEKTISALNLFLSRLIKKRSYI